MKKTWLVCFFAALLCISGCHKKEDTAEKEQENAMVSIAATDFTQADAEALLQQEVRTHCGSANACKVTSVKISGKNITGTYTYEEDGETVEATVSLNDVSVNKNDPSVYTVAAKEFSSSKPSGTADKPAEDNKKPETEDKTDSKPSDDKKDNDSDIPKLKLPDKKLDPNNEEDTAFATITEGEDYYLYRIYLFQPGTLHVSGHYDGGGTFRLVVLKEDQTVANDLIKLTEKKELNYDAKLEAGFYYIYIKADTGGWNVDFKTNY